MKNTQKNLLLFSIITLVGFLMTVCDNSTQPHMHEWGNWTVTTSPTCTTTGIEMRICTNDASHTENRIVPINPNAHIWGAWVQTRLPTVTTDGEDERSCLRVDCHVTETRAIPALGDHIHNWINDWVITSIPTCTTDGVETRICTISGCGITQTRPVTALNHNWVDNWDVTTASTCTATGVETRTCTRSGCGVTQTRSTETLGHIGTWTVVTVPTCISTGLENRTCTRSGCGVFETRSILINLNAHNWGSWVLTATHLNLTSNQTTRTCSHNGSHTDTGSITLGEYLATQPGTQSNPVVETQSPQLCALELIGIKRV